MVLGRSLAGLWDRGEDPGACGRVLDGNWGRPGDFVLSLFVFGGGGFG